MNFKLKAIAAATALVAAASAHADLVGANTGNSSFAMVAFNVVTNAYYVRDLGYSLNTFLPSTITTSAGDGGVTGDKTPEAGLNISWATDSTWASWIAGQNASEIRWTVAAGDSLTAGANGVARALVAQSNPPAIAATNNQVRTSVASSNGVSGLVTQNPTFGYSTTGATVLPSFLGNNAFGSAGLGTLGVASGLYYYFATTQTGSTTTAANVSRFGNSAGFATLTLSTAGDLVYNLLPGTVSEVPLPGAAWLMGAGLLSIGGMLRRRRAAANAEA